LKFADNSVFAIDLGAANINRGRDHGIPGYNAIRAKCGLRQAITFFDFADSISQEKIQALAAVYE
jgi:peroxidase